MSNTKAGKKMKVYVAGPMRGKPYFNKANFGWVTATLRDRGYEVFSPSEHDNDVLGIDLSLYPTGNETVEGFDIRVALAADLKYVTEQADAICVLRGWELSSGATAEVATARALGLIVAPLEGFFAGGTIDPNCMLKSPLGSSVPDSVKSEPQEFRRRFDGSGISARVPDPCVNDALLSREVRTVSSTGGEKGTKPERHDLIPIDPLNLLAELYGRGAAKYAAHNWRRGYNWSNSYAAAQRHMTAFWNGEDIDPEMGTPHVINAAFHMFALAQFMQDYPEFDDRYKK
jgi:hypothetical protein